MAEVGITCGSPFVPKILAPSSDSFPASFGRDTVGRISDSDGGFGGVYLRTLFGVRMRVVGGTRLCTAFEILIVSLFAAPL